MLPSAPSRRICGCLAVALICLTVSRGDARQDEVVTITCILKDDDDKGVRDISLVGVRAQNLLGEQSFPMYSNDKGEVSVKVRRGSYAQFIFSPKMGKWIESSPLCARRNQTIELNWAEMCRLADRTPVAQLKTCREVLASINKASDKDFPLDLAEMLMKHDVMKKATLLADDAQKNKHQKAEATAELASIEKEVTKLRENLESLKSKKDR
jgi:hypothetical protein